MTYLDRIIARQPTPVEPAPVPDLVLTVDGVQTVMSAALAMPAYAAALAAGRVASLRPVNAAPVAPSLPTTPAAVSVAVSTVTPCDDTACDLDRWADPDPDDLPTTVQSTDARGNVETVSRVAYDRVTAQEQWATDAGFKLDTLIYAPGHRVNETGDRNFAKFRRELMKLPNMAGAAQALSVAIAREERRDIALDARTMRVIDVDGLTLDTGHVLTRHSFGQLAAHCGYGPGATYLLDYCDGPQRASNVNKHLSDLSKERPLVLRTRNGDGPIGREIFAAVTPSYTCLDADKILSAVAASPAWSGDERVELTYANARMRATALSMPDHVVDLACGDVFKAGVRISTDDSGKGRIRVSAVLFRNRCENLIIIDEAEVETMSRVHRGAMDVDELAVAIVVAVEAAYGKIAPFLESWGQARAFKVADPKATLAALVEGRDLTLTGMRSGAQRAELVSALHTAFDREPGDSAADLANAITRAAHERTDLFSLDLREELEKQASALILLPGQLLSSFAA